MSRLYTHTRKVESSAVFYLSRIRNRNDRIQAKKSQKENETKETNLWGTRAVIQSSQINQRKTIQTHKAKQVKE